MTPTPQEHSKEKVNHLFNNFNFAEDNEDRVVISGISGLYPQSHNIKELSEVLYNKVNPIKLTSRWKCNHPESINVIGEAPDVESFDAQFFMINYRLANMQDPIARKVLEQAYQAIYDAGLSPEHLFGKKIGVYVALNNSETEKIRLCSINFSDKGLCITGCSRAKYANRISYWLNVRGPSVAINAGNCGSTVALQQACNDINSGRCDGAIVSGSSLCLHPQGSIHYGRIYPLCTDGKVKSFDQRADGTARSDAINTLFLQKAKDALRIYAQVLHVKNEYLPTATSAPCGKKNYQKRQIQFLNEFYEEVQVSPRLVKYVEAFGTGVADVDKAELELIDKVFCKERSEPLTVGSVMSNVGLTEAATGITAITKVLLGYHRGLIAGNLNYTTPRQDIEALRENRLRILKDNERFGQSLSAVNVSCYSGINSHVLLQGYYKPKDINRYKSEIPHLVTVSGRTESAVTKILNDLQSRPTDPEELALLHNIHEKRISGHLYRGYSIFGTNEQNKNESLNKRIEYFDDVQRPLWFVYSGMGSQWTGMGAQLMKIPVFSSSIKRCHKALEPKGVDLIRIVTSNDETIFSDIRNSFLGIAAMQVALTDLVKAIGLVPHKIVGHSVGELGCAYADNCLTAEQMMLAAYYRGAASIRQALIKGSMVAVGMGYKQIVSMCPPGIYVACHNGPYSCTLSGPAEDMAKFVLHLKSQGIFAKEVPCSNIAYHSKYIATAGPWMQDMLTEIIKTPKLRSSSWLSTSVPKENWHKPEARYSSAEYFTNNLLSPVLFEEILPLVPSNAVLVEIAPHGLLQSILKQSLPDTCSNIALARRANPDNTLILLKAFGQLYNAGYNLKIKSIYPKVEYPVSTGTPFLSHLVEWMHEEKWSIPEYNPHFRKSLSSCKFTITLHDENSYLRGNEIKGKILYPFAGALVAVWDTLAMSLGAIKKRLSVKFNNINFFNQPAICEQQELKFGVSINKVSGYFEVHNDAVIMINGYISLYKEKRNNRDKKLLEELNLKTEHIYQLLNERDYSYKGDFCSLHKINSSLTGAELLWNKNWTTFIDGMIQFNTLRNEHVSVSQLLYANSLAIDVKEHSEEVSKSNGYSMTATYSAEKLETRCGGVILGATKFINIPASKNNFVLEYMPSYDKVFRSTNTDHDTQEMQLYKKYVPAKSLSNVVLESFEAGNFNALKWVEACQTSNVGVKVNVYFAGINDFDIAIANGTITNTEKKKSTIMSYGMDFSGITESGQRVMGVVCNGAVATQLQVQPELLWPVPEQWSLEEAATVPLSYIHAFYCLVIKSQMRRKNRILVIGGAGALGQAVISIALAHKCDVYTTVSDIRKKQFLQRIFSQLKDEQILSSIDSNLRDKIIIATKGLGCDIVINCTRGSRRQAALQCCSDFGVVIDVVQRHNQESYNLGMSFMWVGKSYFAIDLSSLFKENKIKDIQKLQVLVSDGIKKGFVRPLTSITYAPSEVPRAFRLLAERRHRGRVLLNLRKIIPVAQPRLICSTDSYHYIICDQEDFGLIWAEKLINCGAKKLVISCSSPSVIFGFKVRNWKKKGIEVKMCNEKLLKAEDLESFGSLEGVYIIKTVSEEVLKIAKNFDIMLRKLYNVLSNKHFAVISFEQDMGKQICLDRAKIKLPATFIQIPVLKEFKSGNNRIYDMAMWRGVSDAVEQALTSEKTVTKANFKEAKDSLYLQPLSQVLGINNFSKNYDSCSLRDLRLQANDLQEINAILRSKFNIFLMEDDIQFLTVKQLLNLEQREMKPNENEPTGLSQFFSFVDTDELSASTEMIFLPTKTFDECMTDHEFNIKDPFLCIFPGLEGNRERFRDICSKLKLNALVLQPRLDYTTETVEQMAQRYASILLQNIKLNDTFYLLGYESGIYVTLEVASILESYGLTGKIFCIGFLPEEFQVFLNEQLSSYCTEKSLQDAIITHMSSLMLGDSITEAESTLLKTSLLEEKINICLNILKGKNPCSQQYTQAVIEASYKNICRARSYTVKNQELKSQIILLKPKTNTNIYISAPSEKKILNQNIIVYHLNVPLALAAKDPVCASIINKHLDSKIIAAFEEKNICDSFLDEDLLYFNKKP